MVATLILTALAGSALASPVEISLAVDKVSYLPYEPIYATVTVVNLGVATVTVPQLEHANAPYLMDLAIVSTSGEAMKGPFTICGPRWDSRALDPGESLSSQFDLAERSGRRDAASRGAHCTCFPPGTYTVVAKWKRDYAEDGRAWGRESSNAVTFSVRPAAGEEVAALALYREMYFYQWDLYWGSPGATRLDDPGERVRDRVAKTESLACRIIAEHPVAPYVILAHLQRAWNYHRRLAGPHRLYFTQEPGDGVAWRDSVKAEYMRVLQGYPDSPIAEFTLRNLRFGEVFENLEAEKAVLDGLSTRYAQTRVGREARRQLEFLGPGGIRKQREP